MRIAVLTGAYPRWSEQFIQRETTALAARGHELVIWPCESPAAEGRWYRPDGSPFPPVEWTIPVCPWRPAAAALARCGLFQTRLLSRVLRAAALLPWRPDLLCAHFAGLPAVAGVGLAAALGTPLVVSAHAQNIWVPRQAGLRALARAQRVVCCNRATAGEIERLCPGLAEPVQVIYHGLPASTEAADAPDRRPEALVRRPGQILACGRFVPKKGLGTLLQAFVRVQSARADARLCLVGEGPEHLRLGCSVNELALDRARVDIRSRQPAGVVADLMRQAAVLAVPSIVAPDGDRDGIPNVILEAFAARLPVVATEVGGIPEAVRDGETGWLVPPGDPAALAAALLEVLDNPAEALRRADQGVRRLREAFDLDANVAHLETVLASVLAGSDAGKPPEDARASRRALPVRRRRICPAFPP